MAEIYQSALRELAGDESPLHYGPSHIVWDDENFHAGEWCLEHFDEYRGDYSLAELAIVRKSLEELSRLPLSIRCIEPEEYDDLHPELYPPSVETVRHR